MPARLPTILILAAAAACVFSGPAAAQPHIDIHLYTEGGELRTGAFDFDGGGVFVPDVRAFRGWFGEVANGTNDPGYNASAGTFAPGTIVAFDILDALRKWDGVDFSTIPAERLFISLGATNRQTPTVADAFVAGFNIAAAGSSGGLHQHINYFLTTPFSAGVYLLRIQLRAQGFAEPSAPVYIVFNQNTPQAEHDAAFEHVRTVILAPPACPGDANRDGVVSFPDITAVLQNWGAAGAPWILGDANGDGVVSFPDITAVLQNWGSVCP